MISTSDLPATLLKKFPARFAGLSLSDIRKLRRGMCHELFSNPRRKDVAGVDRTFCRESWRYRKALKSPEPIVRQNALDELDELECKEALPCIAGLLDDPDEGVREAAHWAVGHLESV